MDRYRSHRQKNAECGTFQEEERSRVAILELDMARAAVASAAGEHVVDAVGLSQVEMGRGKKDAASMSSAARTVPSMGRPSGPGTRRSPSPAIGASKSRVGDNAPRSTSATRSSKVMTSRSYSLTRAPSTTSENAFCRNLNSSPHCHLISKSKSDYQPKPHSNTLLSMATTAEVNIRSPIRPIRPSAKLPDSPTTPSPKNMHQKKSTLEGPIRTKNVLKDSGLRLSGGLEAISGVSASRRHSLSAPLAQRLPSTPRRRTSDPRSLQQVDSKAGEDVRLDLRGQNLWRLDQIAAYLTSKLEFVYLRDNKLSSLEGLETLRRVKVLDLSFNEFEGSGFEAMANCKALQQLYLAGNQITSLSTLPQLPSLEFLSVAQNKLKSLIMSSQPKLQVLAASSNKISTFKGFPHLPVLEHLRLEENPILDIPHVEAASILVVGETLKRFNNQDLSVEEQKLALSYPAHTALCLREGWDFCSVDKAFESTLQFLMAQWRDRLPPGLSVQKAVIDSPSEEDCCSCCFLLEKESGIQEDIDVILTYQWFLGDKSATNFLPIEGAITKTYWPKRQDIGRCLKAECKPVIQGTEFPSIFAISAPVTAGTGCPKVLSLRVDGELTEGKNIHACAKVAWCGGTPGKAIVSWLRRHGGSSPVAIMGAEDHEYLLTVDDVGANLLLMYTPVTEEGVKGESQFATTALIQAAAPCVRNVHVIGPLVEGATIKGAGRYFGGREGKSMFEWLREDVESGKFELASRGTVEYCLSKDDVGLRLMFSYTPVNIEGFQGDPVSTITSKVLVAPPKVIQLKILGDIREGNIVSISASIVGGLEDASRVQWFKTLSAESSLEDASLEAISSSKVAKDFRIPVGAVGYYLAAKYIPGRSDGEYGEAVLVISEQVVQMLPPSLTFLSVNGEAKEGETLTASYGYIGGHEGSSEYSWYLHEDESDLGILITSASGLLQYKVSADAINKLISFRCTPVREDGTAGESRSTMMQEYVQPGLPRLISLGITGDPMEGASLQVDKKYWGGSEGSSKIQWLLKMATGLHNEIPEAICSSYRVRKDDITSSICVSYEPVRADGVKGPVVVSQAIGPVLPGPPTCESLKIIGQPIEGGCLSYEAVYIGGDMGVCRTEWFRRSACGKDVWLSNSGTLDLTSKDVGCYILLRFTPVREDGLLGAPLQMLSDVIKNADPVGLGISISECSEGKEIVPKKSYYGGAEGLSDFRWFRMRYPINGSTLPDDAILVANTPTYTPTPKDVGMHLGVSWTPVRSDGKVGKPLITCSSGSVVPAFPSVKNVTIKQIGTQKLLGQGDYLGGSEGNSKLSWFRESKDGTLTLIEGANSESYTIVEEDYTHTLVFGYTPVREDGTFGEGVLSEKSPVILPGIPRPLKLLLSGKAIESELLSSTGVMFENEADEITWHKYKKDVKYQWLRSSSPGVSKSFETLPLQRTSSYKVRSEDVDYVLRCECTMTDVFGRNMEPVAAMTSLVSPGQQS
ncbi:hypothetical protein L7F22_036233 [Adiantum nelumboides]|nr:hypothetical protein [Adiantum nelumboides]